MPIVPQRPNAQQLYEGLLALLSDYFHKHDISAGDAASMLVNIAIDTLDENGVSPAMVEEGLHAIHAKKIASRGGIFRKSLNDILMAPMPYKPKKN